MRYNHQAFFTSPSPRRTQHGEAERILRQLRAACAPTISQKTPARFPALERTIWRAGELRLRETVPYLLHLLGSGEAWRDYCIAWALGWCGDESAALPLARLTENAKRPLFVRRIAREALLKLFDNDLRDLFQHSLAGRLPNGLREIALSTSANQLAKVLTAYWTQRPNSALELVETLYLIDRPEVRAALLQTLQSLPLSESLFNQLFQLYQPALYRRDAELLGLLASRCETACVRALPFARRAEKLRGRIWQALSKLSNLGEAAFANRVISVWLGHAPAAQFGNQQQTGYELRRAA